MKGNKSPSPEKGKSKERKKKDELNALIFSYIFTSFVLFNPLRDLKYTMESKAIASGVQVYSEKCDEHSSTHYEKNEKKKKRRRRRRKKESLTFTLPVQDVCLPVHAIDFLKEAETKTESG